MLRRTRSSLTSKSLQSLRLLISTTIDHDVRPTMNDATRTTLFLFATAATYTFVAYLCGATLPPKIYFPWAAMLGLQALLCGNSTTIARRIRGPTADQVDVYKTEMFFVLIVCAGSTYSLMAKLSIHEGITAGARDGHEVFLIIMTGMIELVWIVAQTGGEPPAPEPSDVIEVLVADRPPGCEGV